MSRGTVRTPENREAILSTMVQTGKPFEVAAASVGISPRAAWQWKAADPEFADDLARAKLAGASTLHDQVLRGDDKGISFGPSRAALALLGRTNPRHYSEKIQISVAHELDRFLSAAERVLPPEMCELLLAELARTDEQPEEEAGEA
jgi:hypothetical protein